MAPRPGRLTASRIAAWRSTTSTIRLITIDTHNGRTVIDAPPGTQGQAVSWSPDSSRIAYAATLRLGDNAQQALATVSPDGTDRKLFWNRDSNLYYESESSGRATRLVAGQQQAPRPRPQPAKTPTHSRSSWWAPTAAASRESTNRAYHTTPLPAPGQASLRNVGAGQRLASRLCSQPMRNKTSAANPATTATDHT